MRFYKIAILLGLVIIAPSVHAANDTEIKQAIIQESLASYPGNCPCPYNTDKAGRSCGKRSAYSKAGGYNTICYPDDVTEEMIENYRSRHNIAR